MIREIIIWPDPILKQVAKPVDGVDDTTWLYHLRAGDYSRWFRDAIKDDDLAEATAAVDGVGARGRAAGRPIARRQRGAK